MVGDVADTITQMKSRLVVDMQRSLNKHRESPLTGRAVSYERTDARGRFGAPCGTTPNFERVSGDLKTGKMEICPVPALLNCIPRSLSMAWKLKIDKILEFAAVGTTVSHCHRRQR